MIEFRGLYMLFAACIVLVLGGWRFTHGFFLNRVELGQFSQCGDFNASREAFWQSQGLGCWAPKRFQRAVVIVVDALRYDFVRPFPDEDALPFHNHMPFLTSLAGEDGSGRLFAFEADPPTVTMQRIKGLTTGSLPTFIDAGNNFGGAQISEDSIISQAKDAGLRLAFVGDDTWMDLFPDAFSVAHPFPSFNVRDLHTVDNGVISQLTGRASLLRGNAHQQLPANATIEAWLRDTDSWDVIIGHMLGVDHVGHRFGPYHAAMPHKLRQTDELLQAVWEGLDNDTLLVVLGDHGMTSDGNHGGSTPSETHAALVLASKKDLLFPTSTSIDSLDTAPALSDWFHATHRCRQVDLVPTLSLLLGLPIPFASTGHVISGLNYGPQPEKAEQELIRLNAMQLHRYVLAYAGAVPELMDEAMTRAISSLATALMQLERDSETAAGDDEDRDGSNRDERDSETAAGDDEDRDGSNRDEQDRISSNLDEQDRISSNLDEQDRDGSRNSTDKTIGSGELRSAISAVTELCRQRWTQFDEAAMLQGALAVLAASLLLWTAIFLPVSGVQIAGQEAAIWVLVVPLFGAILVLLGGLLEIGTFLPDGWLQSAVTAVGDSADAADIGTFQGLVRLSGWTLVSIVSHPVMLASVLASGATLLLVWRTAGISTPRPVSPFMSGTLMLLLLRCALLWSNSFIVGEGNAILGILQAVILLGAISVSHSRFQALMWAGLGMASIRAGWELRSLAGREDEALPLWVVTATCAVVLILLIVELWSGYREQASTAAVVSIGVTCLWVTWWVTEGRLSSAAIDNPIVRLWLPRAAMASTLLIVARCVVSASFASSKLVLLAMLPGLGALSGPAGFVSLVCGVVQLLATLQLYQLLSSETHMLKREERGHEPSGMQLAVVHVWLGFVLHCSAVVIFFSTGHGAQFNKLRFNAAFVGFDDYDFVRSGMSMAAETLSGVLLAAAVIAPVTIDKGPVPILLRARLSHLVSAWMLPWVASCASLMMFLLYSRRHLMVWAIFAPRLAFEMGFLIAAVAAAVAHIALVRDP